MEKVKYKDEEVAAILLTLSKNKSYSEEMRKKLEETAAECLTISKIRLNQ